jgi:PAS domain S-box-containing protein
MADASNSGTEILRQIPGVGIDLMNNISLEGNTLTSVLPKNNQTGLSIEHALREAFNGNRKSFEISLFDKFFNFFFIPVQSGSGSIDQVMLMSQDMTDQYESRQRLKASEARYRAIVEDQTDLICRMLPDGNLTFVNDAFCEYYEKSIDELIGQSVLPFLPQALPQNGEPVLNRLTPENPVVRIENSQHLADGSVRW